MPSTYTYTHTHTLTEQEKTIEKLNNKIFGEIKASFEGTTDAKYPYKAISKNTEFLDTKPMNLYEEGVLIGDDFCIYKREGDVGPLGTDIHYVYISDEGEIYSFGSEYDKCYVILPGIPEINLTDFNSNPDVAPFLESVSLKFDNKENKGPKL